MKKNKKKVLFVALLLFVAIGFTGFGVYSYYWTQGDFNSDSDYIKTDKSFDPQGTYKDGSSYSTRFLGYDGDVEFTCSDDDHDGYLTCTGYSPVYNYGSVKIDVSYSNFSITCDDASIDTSSITPTFIWKFSDDSTSSNSSIKLNQSESATLVTTFEIESPGTSSTPEEVSEPVAGNTLNVGMTIDLTATQEHYWD